MGDSGLNAYERAIVRNADWFIARRREGAARGGSDTRDTGRQGRLQQFPKPGWFNAATTEQERKLLFLDGTVAVQRSLQPWPFQTVYNTSELANGLAFRLQPTRSTIDQIGRH